MTNGIHVAGNLATEKMNEKAQDISLKNNMASAMADIKEILNSSDNPDDALTMLRVLCSKLPDSAASGIKKAIDEVSQNGLPNNIADFKSELLKTIEDFAKKGIAQVSGGQGADIQAGLNLGSQNQKHPSHIGGIC